MKHVVYPLAVPDADLQLAPEVRRGSPGQAPRGIDLVAGGYRKARVVTAVQPPAGFRHCPETTGVGKDLGTVKSDHVPRPRGEVAEAEHSRPAPRQLQLLLLDRALAAILGEDALDGDIPVSLYKDPRCGLLNQADHGPNADPRLSHVLGEVPARGLLEGISPGCLADSLHAGRPLVELEDVNARSSAVLRREPLALRLRVEVAQAQALAEHHRKGLAVAADEPVAGARELALELDQHSVHLPPPQFGSPHLQRVAMP
mmetsp:Transcript_101235/g.286900  ORF Transcript_101235/g.286900 Transcript_101235/m.286900 type:complete len:258 (-) Transcript_101235:779-1552(-)